jgi:hypothetical protein
LIPQTMTKQGQVPVQAYNPPNQQINQPRVIMAIPVKI